MANTSSLLEHELDVCDETSLRLLLKNICAEIPAARTLALELLALDEYDDNVTDSETLVVEETGDRGDTSEGVLLEDGGPSRKRKAEDISRDEEEGHVVGGMSRGSVGLGGNTTGVDLGREVGLAAPRSIGVVEQRIRDLEKNSGVHGTPVVVLSDSEGDDDNMLKGHHRGHHYNDEEEEEEEEEYEDDFNENEFDCRFCGETYNEDENHDEACCTHDEGTYISGDCPLSKEEQAKLPDDSEWHVYACCGEPANEEGNGCRVHAHAPDRGMGY